MSEHVWAQDQLAAYVAGGCDAQESERLEAHLRECPACTVALKDARALDRGLGSLFAAVQPGPALEDRLIRRMRTTSARDIPRMGWKRKLTWAVAASVGLGITGAGISAVLGSGELPFPGESNEGNSTFARAVNNLKQIGLGAHDNEAASSDKISQAMRTSENARWSKVHGEMYYLEQQDKQVEALGSQRNSIHGESTVANGRDPDAMARALGERNLASAGGTPKFYARVDYDGSRMSSLAPSLPAPTDGTSNTFAFNIGNDRYAPPVNRGGFGGGGNIGGGGFGGTGGGFGGGGISGTGMTSGMGPTAAWGSLPAVRGTPTGQLGNSSTVFTPPYQVPPLQQSAGGAGIPPDGGVAPMSGGPGTPSGTGLPAPPPLPPKTYTYTQNKFVPVTVTKSVTAMDKTHARGFSPDGKALAGANGDATTNLYVLESFQPNKQLDTLKMHFGEAEKAYKKVMDATAGVPPAAGDPQPQKAPEPAAPVVAPVETSRKIIRSGDIEFEIESFDSAVAGVTRLVMGIKGAFIATINSEKLPNGKVKGSIVVRTPPEALDGLVLDLRRDLGKGGELKGQRIGSQDITKQYTDTESRLRAAKSMQERLLDMIKNGKGEIKQLLEAEKELGVWRTKIEEMEGELRYFSNQVSLSTLTITLAEKEIRAAAGLTETEKVLAGIEVEDVDKAYRDALAAIMEAKGRVIKSDLKQLTAGQFNANLQFEVAPDASGPMRDRLKQLGRMARLEIDRVQQAEGGTPQRDAKVKRGDALFLVSIYNLANVAARESTTVNVAALNVPVAYKALQDAVSKTKGRILTAKLDEQDRQNVTAQFDFEVPRGEETAIQAALTAAGEILSRNGARAPETDSTTDSKILFRTKLMSLANIAPRESATMQVAALDVPTAYRALQDAVSKAKGRVITAKLEEQDRQNVTAQFDFEVPRAEEPALQTALTAAGEILSRNVGRAPESDSTTDSKVLFRTTLFSTARTPPRETAALFLVVENVDVVAAAMTAQVAEVNGRTVAANVSHERDGKVSAKLVYTVPLSAAREMIEKFKATGTVRTDESTRDPQAKDSKSAIALIDVTLANPNTLVAKDDGLWPQIRGGLGISIRALLASLSWLIVFLGVVVPWGLLGYGVYRVVRRLFFRPAAAQPQPSPATPAA